MALKKRIHRQNLEECGRIISWTITEYQNTVLQHPIALCESVRKDIKPKEADAEEN
jgi:hypothetical protein